MKFPTTAQRRRGLGPAKKGNAHGLLVHSMIAVDDTSGACLGLVGGQDLRRHHPQRIAAAKTGVSERTGRRIEGDPRLPSQKFAERPRRRQVVDPLGGLWESDILPLLASRCGIRPVTLLGEMLRRHPDGDWGRPAPHPGASRPGLVRRKRRGPRSHLPSGPPAGPARPVGLHRYGGPRRSRRRGGVCTPSLHFVLTYSAWEHAEVVLGGESFTALACGLQNALCALGGAPREHRSDSLSAAFRNLDQDAADDQTRRYQALCAHCGMQPTRNNRGLAHENGAIESQHGHLKRVAAQALLLRGSSNFDSLGTCATGSPT